jgi:MFS family permease
MGDAVGAALRPVSALLIGAAVLFVGNGLQSILLPVRGAAEGFSTTTIGVVMAAYYVGFVVGCLMGPRLVRRAGHIRLFAALAAMAASAGLAHALWVDPVAWGVFRMLSGFCFAGLYMVMESWINEKAENRTRGRIVAFYSLVDLGASTVGQLMLNLGDPGGFVLFCYVAILVCCSLVPVALTRAEAPAAIQAVRLRPRKLYDASPLGVVGCFTVGLVSNGFWALGPVYASTVGFATAGITLFMAAAMVGAAILQWPMGWLSDVFDRRRVITVFCFAAAGASGVLALSTGAPREIVFAAAALFGGLTLPLYALFLAHVNDWIETTDFVEVSGGLLLVYGVGSIGGPLIGAPLMEFWGPGAMFAAAAVALAFLGGFALWRSIQRDPVPLEEQEAFVPVQPTSPADFDPRSEDDPEEAGN